MQTAIMLEQKIYSVSELNQKVRHQLETEFSTLWIEGEISNLACPSSGHVYFVLKDAHSQIRCAMFASRQRGMNVNFENGLQVLVKGRVSLYETRGEYQFIADFVEVAGHGKLQQAFEALKQKLSAEGLFDEKYKKQIPRLPKIIGVITSPTGAAIRDMISVLKRRFPQISVIIYPTLVQGQQASQQIVNALEIANRHKACDVLVLARGGGSLEDLWSFNEENVARAIFNSELPTVSAIGHEIDFTIADFVADLRAPTPSAAAELISPDRADWFYSVQQNEKQLLHLIRKMIQEKNVQTENLKKRLRHPRETLLNHMQHLDQLEQTLIRVQTNLFQRKQLKLTGLSEKMDALSPLKTLHRGYAIVSDSNHHILQSINQLAIDEVIQTKFADGTCTSRVESISAK